MKTKIKHNMIWNSSGLAVETLTGFLVLPFLIATLGNTTYGVWLVLGALSGYFGLLQLGVRAAIGRHVALYSSQKNQLAVNQTLTGGATVLLSVGSLAVLVLLMCESWFFRSYAISTEDQAMVSIAFRLMAINVALVLVFGAFDATLWGFQRFDWINAIDIPIALLRMGFTFALVRSSSDLAILASFSVALTALAGILKALLCFHTDPLLRIGLRYLSRSRLWELFGYGSWNVIRTVAQMTRTQLPPILIGSLLGLVFVPVYAVASRLLSTVGGLIVSFTGVLTPHATVLHATNQIERQRYLFLVGGSKVSAIGIFLIGFLLVLGGSFINLWVGPDFTASATLLMILVVGELLPNTQYVTNGIILAMARHRTLAFFSIVEAIAVIGLLVILLPLFGLVGVGLAKAIPAVLTRGIATMIYGCHVVDVPFRKYLMQSIIPALLCGGIPALMIWCVSEIYPIDTWFGLIAYSGAYTAIFALCYFAIFERKRLKSLFSSIQSRKSLASPARSCSADGS